MKIDFGNTQNQTLNKLSCCVVMSAAYFSLLLLDYNNYCYRIHVHCRTSNLSCVISAAFILFIALIQYEEEVGATSAIVGEDYVAPYMGARGFPADLNSH